MSHRCTQPGRVLGVFIDAGAELDDDDPAVLAAPDRFEKIVKKAAKKKPAKKAAAKK